MSARLHIGIVTPGMERDVSGPSRWVSTLVERLCSAGQCVTLVTGDLVSGGRESRGLMEVDRRARVNVFPVRGRLNRTLYRSVDMGRWLKKNVAAFDVIDIQGVWSFVTATAARTCAEAGVPYVITPHGQMARWDWNRRPWRKRVFFELLLRRGWHSAAAVRFLTDGERRNSAVGAGSR